MVGWGVVDSGLGCPDGGVIFDQGFVFEARSGAGPRGDCFHHIESMHRWLIGPTAIRRHFRVRKRH